MKVCFISSFYPPLLFGGAEIYVRRIAEKLVLQGIEVTVITTDKKISLTPAIEYINGVKVYRIHPLNIYPIYTTLSKPVLLKPFWYMIDIVNVHSYFVIRKILMAEKPDLVHIHNFKGFSFAFDAVKSQRLPLIFTIHDYFLECVKETLFNRSCEICTKPRVVCRLYAQAQKFLKNNKPDIVTAPSQFVIDKMKKDGFFDKSRALKLPLGIELSGIEKNDRNYTTIQILFVGRLNRFKGLETLIHAFKQIRSTNARLHIVGEGTEEAEFRKCAGTDPAIMFHGFICNKDLVTMYKQSHMLVVPSVWYETFGIVIIEGFSYGLPVIASNIGGFPELVDDGENGLLFEAGNAEQLRQKLEFLIEKPQEIRRMSDRAYMTAQKYRMDEHIKKLICLYHDVIRE
jgi:glycosyltransferase involved in cell wall biosynthesis